MITYPVAEGKVDHDHADGRSRDRKSPRPFEVWLTRWIHLGQRPPTVPGGGGTVVTPTGFEGRNESLDAYWDTVVFRDDFPSLTEDFFKDYKLWLSYAQSGTAFTTNANPAKGGNGDHYVTNTSAVRDVKLKDGKICRLLVGTMKTKKATSDKKNWGVQYQPKFTFGKLGTSSLPNYCLQMAVGVSENVDGWKKAGLWWNDKKVRPKGGEDDFDETSSPWNFGAFYHLDGATSGSDQIHFGSQVNQVGTINVLRAEASHGKSFKLFVNDVQLNPDNFDALLQAGTVRRQRDGHQASQQRPPSPEHPARARRERDTSQGHRHLHRLDRHPHPWSVHRWLRSPMNSRRSLPAMLLRSRRSSSRPRWELLPVMSRS